MGRVLSNWQAPSALHSTAVTKFAVDRSETCCCADVAVVAARKPFLPPRRGQSTIHHPTPYAPHRALAPLVFCFFFFNGDDPEYLAESAFQRCHRHNSPLEHRLSMLDRYTLSPNRLLSMGLRRKQNADVVDRGKSLVYLRRQRQSRRTNRPH